MEIEIKEHCIIVAKEKGDPKYYGVANSKGESNLLYAIKNKLNSMGFDLIKKHMWKDGHLVSEMQQYLRTRKPTGNSNKDIMIWNPRWQIEGAEVPYNDGQVKLSLEKDVFTNNGGMN